MEKNTEGHALFNIGNPGRQSEIIVLIISMGDIVDVGFRFGSTELTFIG